jgi:hypothetical protein
MFADVNGAFHVAARKILINDDTIEKFRFMLPGKGDTEVDIKGMSSYCCTKLKTMLCNCCQTHKRD